MPTIPCSSKITCPGTDVITGVDEPFRNISSEAPDQFVYISINWGWDYNIPPPGTIFNDPTLPCDCSSPVSQAAADLCAAQCQLNRTTGGGGGGGGGGPGWTDPGGNPIHTFNNNQDCCAQQCPDGTTVVLCQGAGTVSALSQTMADRIGRSLACNNLQSSITQIFNTTQTATVNCNPPGTGNDPVSGTIPAGTYGGCISGGPDAWAAAQAQFNQQAYNAALSQANSNLRCGTCNGFLHGVASCPANPQIIASITIQPGTICLPFGTPQVQADSAASVSLNNQLTASLKSQGCACPGPTVSGTTVTGDTCGEFYHVYLGTPIPANYIKDIFTNNLNPYNPVTDFGPNAGLVTLTPFNNPYNVISLYLHP